jgi:radical SAM protein with 4Fe4S-binding SPASM domain
VVALRFQHELKSFKMMLAGRRARKRLLGCDLRNLTFCTTFRCNARCEMCDIWNNPTNSGRPDLSLEEIEKLARSERLRDLVSLSLTGGEAFLRNDIAEMVAVFEKHTGVAYTSLATNGFSTERIMGEVRRMLELSQREIWISVSIDAVDERHDRIRGVKGIHEKSINTLKELVALRQNESRLGVGILFTMLPETVDQMVPVYRLAQELGVQYTLNVINCGDVYYQKPVEPFIAGYREKLPEIKANLEALRAMGLRHRFFHCMGGMIEPYVTETRGQLAPCFSGFTSAYIGPGGEVYSCVPASEKQLMGDLREDDFDAIWQSEQARRVREGIFNEKCRCLLTCEMSNTLKYSPGYFFSRLLPL